MGYGYPEVEKEKSELIMLADRLIETAETYHDICGEYGSDLAEIKDRLSSRVRAYHKEKGNLGIEMATLWLIDEFGELKDIHKRVIKNALLKNGAEALMKALEHKINAIKAEMKLSVKSENLPY